MLGGHDQALELKVIGVDHSGISLIPFPKPEAFLDKTFFLIGDIFLDMFIAFFQERNAQGTFFKE